MTAHARTELVHAGFFSRLSAFVVDLVVLTAAIGASSWTVRNVELLLRPAVRMELEPALQIALPVLVVAYYVGLWAAFGQTVGKRLLGLRVVGIDGGRIGLGRAALRFVGYFASALPAYLGFAWVLVDPRHRGWHDLLARTLVVHDRGREADRPDVANRHVSPDAVSSSGRGQQLRPEERGLQT